MIGEKSFLQRAVEVTEDEVARLKVKLAHAETALKFYADQAVYEFCEETRTLKTRLIGDSYLVDGKPYSVGGARAVQYFKTFPD
jgi:hypothetical protein